MDYDIAYANGDFIPGAASYPETWQDRANEWREVEGAMGRARLNLPYGEGARQVLDLFYPKGRPAGLMVFVHGGYWRAFDHRMWSHFSAGATDAGWAVAMPSYTLAPQVRISNITTEIARAITFTARKIAGPIALVGHSAGGHLVARMLCGDVDLPKEIRSRLHHVMPISPLSDLRPLLHTKMNADFRLSMEEAERESPVLATDVQAVPTTVWVGAEERPVFIDQANWLAEKWDHASIRMAPGRHHFDVIDPLCVSDSAMVRRLLGL